MNRLPFHEWVIVSLLVIAFLTLALVTQFKQAAPLPPVQNSHLLVDDSIVVTIKGAITRPGDYSFKRGARLKELLAQAEPLPEADLESIKSNSKMRDGQIIKIASQRWITIQVEGAVESPGAMRVKHGTNRNELIEQLSLLPEADVSKLQTKRLLRNGEVLQVPVKKAPRSIPKKPRVTSKKPNSLPDIN